MRTRVVLAGAAGCFLLLLALAGLLGTLAWRSARAPAPSAGPGAAPIERLVVAARDGDAAIVRSLAASGVDLDQPVGGNGWTPLLHAVHTRSRTGARALLEAGADPNRPGSGGQRPLLMASAYGDAGMVALLLEAGADPRLGGQGWRNALEAALTGSLDIDGLTFSRCQPGTVRVLLERAPDLVPRGPAGRLGRFFAYARGCEEVERLLEAPPPPALAPGQ
jgi:hypothetical protein